MVWDMARVFSMQQGKKLDTLVHGWTVSEQEKDILFSHQGKKKRKICVILHIFLKENSEILMKKTQIN